MLFTLRSGLLAITILILAEDFQYLLKAEPFVLGQIEREQGHFCDDCDEEDNEGKSEKEEEGKKEMKEEDENNSNELKNLSLVYSRFAKNVIGTAFQLLSDATRELESPPPERF